MSDTQMRAFAKIGAASRLEMLQDEVDSILRAFPELGRGSRGRSAVGTSAPSPRRRRTRTMSAAQKRAVSKRMRAYWAKRRQEKATKASAAKA
jgi:hypothetical protein